MEERAEEERAKPRPPRLTGLQEQLVWALLESGLSRDVLVQAIGELERDRATADRRDRGDGESSEEGEMDFSPPIFRDLEKLPSEQASKLKAEVEQLLQYVETPPRHLLHLHRCSSSLPAPLSDSLWLLGRI